ncbi:Uncharacterised protein [uncultured archaeon]|nr:Uncharacterised protein [uncultured archaeon]
MPPSSPTIKRLFAMSGNKCAFPGCQVLLTGDAVIGEVCHIEADKPGGPRYNSAQTEDERHAFENLMLMCANHHKVIDSNPESFTVARLKEIKRRHEEKYAGGKEPSDDIVAKLLQPFIITGPFHGPTVISQGQMGGQTAMHINNLGLMPRIITQASGDALVAELQNYPSEPFYIQYVGGDQEIFDFAETLEAVLVAAKWNSGGMSMVIRYPPLVRWGIRLFAPDNPGVQCFLQWLNGNGFEVEPHIRESDSVTIQVGHNR